MKKTLLTGTIATAFAFGSTAFADGVHENRIDHKTGMSIPVQVKEDFKGLVQQLVTNGNIILCNKDADAGIVNKKTPLRVSNWNGSGDLHLVTSGSDEVIMTKEQLGEFGVHKGETARALTNRSPNNITFLHLLNKERIKNGCSEKKSSNNKSTD